MGIAGEKARHGGPRGMAGAAADRWWECFRGGRGGCLADGGWRLRGVEVEDELQALDFVSNGCKIYRSEMKFSFDSKIQFRQQNSVSTVRFSFDS